MKRHLDVVGAVIISNGQVLCTQRGGTGPLSGKWEFPGGKIEPDETAEAALAREILEELGCGISVGDKVTTTVYEYDFAAITLTTFYCALTDGRPQLTEHTEMRWLSPAEMLELEWAPADIPAVTLVEEHLGCDRTR